jgi:hypothetical protein
MQPFINHMPPLNQAADIASYCPALTKPSQKFPEESQNVPTDKICPSGIQSTVRWALSNKLLLTVHFTTVFEYICYLETIARCCKVRLLRMVNACTLCRYPAFKCAEYCTRF